YKFSLISIGIIKSLGIESIPKFSNKDQPDEILIKISSNSQSILYIPFKTALTILEGKPVCFLK
ncbi:hypothetical protein, partial [Bacillus thuringiensis]|uniref:hypothetical protein n=1 Tax=Bacillus thuringiensis TaxID=1428 RepID=UPI002DBA1FB3